MKKKFLVLLIILIFGLTTNGMARKVYSNVPKDMTEEEAYNYVMENALKYPSDYALETAKKVLYGEEDPLEAVSGIRLRRMLEYDGWEGFEYLTVE